MAETLPHGRSSVPDLDRSPRSLREQQRRLTRRLIIDAFARVVVRDGAGDVQLQTLADEAGCSLRTLYRYFASRDALADGLDEEFREFFDGILTDLGDQEDLDLPSYLATLALKGGERETLARAWSALGRRPATLGVIQSHVTDRIERAVLRAAPDLPEGERLRAVGALRVVAASRTWFALSDALGRESAADTTAWMVRSLLAALPTIADDDPTSAKP